MIKTFCMHMICVDWHGESNIISANIQFETALVSPLPSFSSLPTSSKMLFLSGVLCGFTIQIVWDAVRGPKRVTQNCQVS